MTRVFVPGRANIMGEHTDYNEGLSLPFAIDLGVTADFEIGVSPNVTVDVDGSGHWQSNQPATAEWSRQVSVILERTNTNSGRLLVSSSLPVGVGLSSSAAFAGAILLSIGETGSVIDIAREVQYCERAAGRDVGLLDQLATLGSLEGHALLIDFATLEMRDIAVPASVAFTAVDSGVNRSLATTQYATRRQECRDARSILGDWRTSTPDDLERIDDQRLRSRARHVLSENVRVMKMVAALASDDLSAIGELINQSHVSLRDDYEVSTQKIDEIVDDLIEQPGVYGARVMGGGFGGCVLVVHEPLTVVETRQLQSWRVRPSDGAFAQLGRDR